MWAVNKKCEEIANEISSKCGVGKVYPIAFDASDYLSVKKAVNDFASITGKIDILINCAGGGAREKRKSLDNQDIDLIHEIIGVNLMGTIYSCKEAHKYFPIQGGSVINIASIHGHNGMEYYSEYSASKGGIIAFTKALAKEYSERNIRVNSVSYGLIAREELYGENRVFLRHKNYLNKIPTCEEITSAVLYLASDDAGYITGSDLLVDGGRSLALKGSEEGRGLSELRDYDFAIQCGNVTEKIARNAAGRDIYIYGAGHGGEILARVCKERGVRIAGFYDSMANELNSVSGISIKTPSEALGQHDKQYIVISLMNHNYNAAIEIANRLYGMGFSENDMTIIAEKN